VFKKSAGVSAVNALGNHRTGASHIALGAFIWQQKSGVIGRQEYAGGAARDRGEFSPAA